VKKIDRILQNWRIREASQFILLGSKVLDIGSFDGTLFQIPKKKGIHGTGIEPLTE
jgi:Methionine biosynthesis protein MetW